MKQGAFFRSLDELRFVKRTGRTSADPFEGAEDLDVSVRVVRMTPGPERTPHRHPHSSEVVHVLDGNGEAWIDGERRSVRQGDTFVVPRGAAHATLPSPGSHLELVCFFPHADLSSNLEELDGPRLA